MSANERLGAQERVVAIVGGDPLSRHKKQKCATKWCWRRTYFDYDLNMSSRFCIQHTPRRKRRDQR